MVARTRLNVTFCVHCLSCSFVQSIKLALGHTQPQREGGPSPPASAEVENDWSYAATPTYAFVAWYSLFNRKCSDDGFLRVTWQFSRSVYYLLFRKEHSISESGSAPFHRWKGGEARIQLGPLELM